MHPILKESFHVAICAESDLIKTFSFHHLTCLFGTLLGSGGMGNGRIADRGRDARRRCHSGECGDEVKHGAPDLKVGRFFDNCIQKWLCTVEIKLIGVDGGVQSQKIGEQAFTTGSESKEARRPK